MSALTRQAVLRVARTPAVFRPQVARRTYAEATEDKSVDLKKGARRDPELYVWIQRYN